MPGVDGLVGAGSGEVVGLSEAVVAVEYVVSDVSGMSLVLVIVGGEAVVIVDDVDVDDEVGAGGEVVVGDGAVVVVTFCMAKSKSMQTSVNSSRVIWAISYVRGCGSS